MAFTCLFLAAGINQIQTQDQANANSAAIDDIDSTTCSLARLVNVSLQPVEFGKGTDLSSLTEFDIAVQKAIAKVQKLQPDTSQTLTFRVELKNLEKNTTCDITVIQNPRELKK